VPLRRSFGRSQVTNGGVSLRTRVEDLAHQLTTAAAVVWIIPFFLIPF
jgi:hypothetical protein